MPFKLPEYTWNKDKQLCLRCRHYTQRKPSSPAMVCLLNVERRSHAGPGTCIEMRTSGKCGKEGKLFEPKAQGREIVPTSGASQM